MKFHLLSLCFTLALVSGCASTNRPQPLAEIQERNVALAADDRVKMYAAEAQREANTQVIAATNAWNDNEDELLGHKIYVSDKLLSNAEVRGDLGALNAEYAQSEKRESQLRSQQLSRENAAYMTPMLFDFDSDKLTPAAQKTAVQLADFLTKNPKIRVTIFGHTDSIGTDLYNKDLSSRRAYSVKGFLQAAGIDASRIITSAKGESAPVASNTHAQSREKNRRAQATTSVEN